MGVAVNVCDGPCCVVGSNHFPSEPVTTVAVYDQHDDAYADIASWEPDEEEQKDLTDMYEADEFKAFRQYYVDCLGPPKSFDKMKRSVPRKLAAGQQVDEQYLLKRLKNNAAAKRSRDSKRLKFVDNQISVMYLQFKVQQLMRVKYGLLGIEMPEQATIQS